MIAVTKERFYEVIYTLELDVHPHPEANETRWFLRNREEVGVSTPGYRCVGPKTYKMRPDLVEKASRKHP